MTLLASVAELLRRKGVPHALVGGLAMAAHGLARATLDADVLVVDRAVLDPEFWSELGDAAIDARVGDADDPLAGLVRIRRGDQPVDVIVGRGSWQRGILERAATLSIDDGDISVVTAPDLILLKLYAGGPQDLVDVELLLADDPRLTVAVDQKIETAPRHARDNWRKRRR